MPVSVIDRHGKKRQGKVLQVLGFMGLERVEVPEAEAGDIVAISGVAELGISDTVCALDAPEALPALTVDEPTISMTFQVNNSPIRSEEHTSELQSLMRSSYAVLCWKKTERKDVKI